MPPFRIRYSEAIAKALPHADQVADRWHLTENWSRAFLDAVGKSIRQIRGAIRQHRGLSQTCDLCRMAEIQGILPPPGHERAIQPLSKQRVATRQIVRQLVIAESSCATFCATKDWMCSEPVPAHWGSWLPFLKGIARTSLDQAMWTGECMPMTLANERMGTEYSGECFVDICGVMIKEHAMNLSFVDSGETALSAKPHNHPVLKFMAKAGMRQGESVSVEALIDYGTDLGFELEHMEQALIQASAKGWIFPSDQQIHLTALGYLLLYPANDNVSTP